MANIFISYRREDTRADAGRLYDRLSARFGDQHVFMDIEDIAPGDDFVDVLDDTLEGCDALLVLIGRSWLAGKSGSRLDDPADFVRLEVERALARDILVIPVLVGDAAMPRAADLPHSLAGLATRQALEVSDQRFHHDADELIRVLDARIGRRRSRLPARRRLVLWGALAAGLAVAAGVAYRVAQAPGLVLRTDPQVLSVAEAKAMLVATGLHDTRWNAAAAGAPNRYEALVVEGDTVVVDHASRLVWQKGGSGRPLPHADAAAYVSALNESGFAGARDWRLPTLEQAMSLMEPEVHAGMHLDPVFEALAAPFIWSADRTAQGGGWVVYFLDGICSPESERFNAYVRAVRPL